MKNLDFIAEELFNKIRGRFPSITIGDQEGKVTDQPSAARFFDFQYKQGGKSLGSISVTLTDEAVQVMYNTDVVANEDAMTRNAWYDFLKELRMFAKKRLLNFDTRNIQKSNLDKRDYQFLARQRNGDEQMNEAKLYGTSRKSYQDIGRARVTIEHTKPVNQELASGRTQYIGSLFIESSEGERFKYPFRHLNGARAMARHVSEGGVPHDDFGKYIVSLSEELASLRKFKTYMSRSAVMAEGLSAYSEAVIERIDTIKNTVEKLQRESHYNEAIDTFETAILEDVPTDVAENWIDQLTIRQFNEELKDVFPYIYKLVSEKTVADELGPDDLAEERVDEIAPIIYGLLGLAGAGYAAYKAMPTAKDAPLGRAIKIACDKGDKDACDAYDNLDTYVDANDQEKLQQLVFQYVKEPFGDFKNVPESTTEDEIENAFEELMGQFAENDVSEGFMKNYKDYHCEDCGCQMHNCKPDCQCEHDSHDETGSWWKDDNGNGVPDKFEGIMPEKEKAPVTEFILSMYDRETGQFPKGETAVLTAVEKDYGEQYINPAKAFIEAVNAKYEEFNGYKDPDLMDDQEFTLESFLSNLDEKLKKGDEEMLLALYNTYKDNKMIPKKYRDLMGRVKDELTNKKPAKAQSEPDNDDDPDLDAFGGKGPEVKTAKADTAKTKAPTNKSDPSYDASGDEVQGKYGMQRTAYDPDYNGPDGYLNDADAIEGLMSSSALSSEEDQWLNMAYVKYNITRDNLGQVLKDIRKDVAQKAAASVKNFDQSQESIELERILQIAGI